MERAASNYVGSDACASCHANEHREWTGSQHKAAMQEATEQSVLGDFNDATFEKDGIVSTFFKKEDGFWVRTDGPDGKLADFQIRYTFGIAPLQQYLIELSGGRLQALGIAWDARPRAEGGQKWFHLYPDRTLIAGEPLHWTGIDQNWNYQCAYCHSTNLKKNLDAASGAYNTTWSEISVGCEACHGPASAHLKWASSGGDTNDASKGLTVSFHERRGVAWSSDSEGKPVRSAPRATTKEINVCAQCHARRQQFADQPESPDGLANAFRPSTLQEGLYHADGQQRDEVFTHGSFVQSRMFAAGVTCSDCHNPHSGKLHKTGNAVCTSCHAADRFATPAHHHHVDGGKGSECVACHMPTKTYMGVDPRHDHSIRIPRPDRSITLDTPNACNSCHTDKTVTWARDAIKGWVPSPKTGMQDFAEAFVLGDRGAAGAQESLNLILKRETSSPIAIASALDRLSSFPSAEALALAAQKLSHSDATVRSAAVRALGNADHPTRRNLLAPLLKDEARTVRMDAARALAGSHEAELAPDQRAAFDKAISEYIDAQLFNAERAEAHANLASLYRERGQTSQARGALERAISLDPTFVPAAIALADLIRTGGDERAAEQTLIQALSHNSKSAPLQHALGLSLVRQKRVDEALDWLSKAVENSPQEPRFAYVLGVALHDTGKRAEALAALKKAVARHPYDRDVLWVLASYEIEGGELSVALQRVQLLTELEPGRAEFAQALVWLKQKQR